MTINDPPLIPPEHREGESFYNNKIGGAVLTAHKHELCATNMQFVRLKSHLHCNILPPEGAIAPKGGCPARSQSHKPSKES